MRELIKKWFKLYDIEDLQSGAHCGCCGRWVVSEIIEKSWPITVCKKCLYIGEKYP
jgi:hypothetical protein